MKIEQTKDIRTANRLKILNNILTNKTISRADISEQTGLNKATVSTIVKEWIDLNILTETSLGDSTGGRKPILLKQVCTVGYCIALDIQVTKIKVIVTDLDNQIVQHNTIPLVGDSFTSNYKQLYQLLDKIIANHEPSPYGLVGIGVCVRGIVDLDGMIRFIPKLKWRNIDLITLLKERYHVPVYVDNDGNLSALNEYKNNPQYNDLAVINITDVLSTGLIANGKIIEGHHGFANAIGHHTVKMDETVQCSCGKYGCWEQYCSNSAIISEMNKHLETPIRSIEEFISMVKIQDSIALKTLQCFIKYLALGICNIIFFLDSEVVIINSQILTALPYIIPEVLKNIVLPITQTEDLLVSKLGEDSAILGASSQSISRFYEELANTL